MINPYQPPESAPANQTHNCPVCKGPIGFWRFAFPLGYCQHCRNYLIVVPISLRAYRFITFTPPIGTFILIWLIAMIVHSKIYGRLVPAYCWGFFAVQDDDRINTDDG